MDVAVKKMRAWSQILLNARWMTSGDIAQPPVRWDAHRHETRRGNEQTRSDERDMDSARKVAYHRLRPAATVACPAAMYAELMPMSASWLG